MTHYNTIWRTTVAWILIIAAVLVTQIPHHRTSNSSQAGSENKIDNQLMGKYMVGVSYMIRSLNAPEDSMEPFANRVKNSNHAPVPLEMIPVLAELAGKEAAIDELKRLAAQPGNDDIAGDVLLFLDLYEKGSSSLGPGELLSVEGYGWSGRLALSHDKPDDDQSRRRVLRSAFRVFIVMLMFFMGAIAALLAGLVLLILAIIFRAKGKLKSSMVRPGRSSLILLEAFALFLTGLITLPSIIRLFFQDFGLLRLTVIPLMALAFLWPVFCGLNWKTFRTAIGWRRGKGLFRETGAGIVGYIAGLPLMLAAAIITGLLIRYTGAVPSHPMVHEMTRGPGYMLLWGIMACVWAPVVEETFFRGAFFGYLRQYMPWAVSGIVSGLLFAVIHPQGLAAVPLLAVIGFNLGAIREWRGSVIASISAHALNNGTVFVLLFLMLSI